MSYNLTETQQIEELKKIWREYGIAVVAGVVIALTIVLGWHFYKSYKTTQAQQASVIYQDVIIAGMNNNGIALFDKSNELIEKYPSTAYATLAALTLAKINVGKNDLNAAEQNLFWVISHTKIDSIRTIAQIRLARIYIANKQNESALKILNSIHDKTFNTAVYEATGDLYSKEGNKIFAKKYYQKAIDSIEGSKISHSFLEMKLQSIS